MNLFATVKRKTTTIAAFVYWSFLQYSNLIQIHKEQMQTTKDQQSFTKKQKKTFGNVLHGFS
jgi:hypothetical protein